MRLAVDNSPSNWTVTVPAPKSAQEEVELVEQFLAELRKLLGNGGDPEGRARLLKALQHPLSCSRCAAACHVFEGSGHDELYRPGRRADLLRRLYFKYVRDGGRLANWWRGEVELSWPMVAELAQTAFQCNQCERCRQSCGASDHSLVARELRALFREMGIAPGKERRASLGSIRDRIAEIDEQTSRRAGIEFHTPWDVAGAEVLLIQPTAAVADCAETVGALGLLLSQAEIRWTMSSELAGVDLAEVRQYGDVARGMRVKKIVVGESGPGYRALCVDEHGRAGSEMNPPRESAVTLMRDVVRSGRVKFDELRNDFPVTLHDPCALARHAVVEPQREILRCLGPQFREMNPWAERSYCCGGGGGLVQVSEARAWRVQVAGRKKIDQVMEAFSECLEDTETRKYLCAPCHDCRRQLCDLLAEHAPWETSRILCGGLAELVVNAMEAARPGFLQWEWR